MKMEYSNQNLREGDVFSRFRRLIVMGFAFSLVCSLFYLASSQGAEIPHSVSGTVFDVNLETGGHNYCLADVEINVSGNVSGLLWSGFSGDFGGLCNSYTTCGRPCTMAGDINWTAGELITVIIANSGAAGYTGQNSTLAPSLTAYDLGLDIYATDIQAPKYSSIGTVPAVPRSSTDVTLKTTWSDNSGVLTVILSHNVSGNWTNETLLSSDNASINCNVSSPGVVVNHTIQSTSLTRGQVVGFRYEAIDPSNHTNNTMPVQTFTVANGLPEVGWIAMSPYPPTPLTNLTCSYGNVSDVDGDNLTVRIKWYRNKSIILENTSNLSTDYFGLSDRIQCEAVPNDGIEDGITKNLTHRICPVGTYNWNISLIQGYNLISPPVLLD